MSLEALIRFFIGNKTLPKDAFHRLETTYQSAKILVRLTYLYAATSFYESLSSPQLLGKVPIKSFPGLSYPFTFLSATTHLTLMVVTPACIFLTFLFPRSLILRISCFGSAFPRSIEMDQYLKFSCSLNSSLGPICFLYSAEWR